jgi:hypothetical protein
MTVTNAPSAGKEEIISTLRTHLHAVMRERHAAHSNDNLFPAYQSLRQFQSARLASTYADLLADKTTRSAALFFLEDLYGTKDFTQRDADIERIIPIMERLLPVAALHYVSQAIELDALSESLDTAMALRLGEQFTQETYVIAYRDVGSRSERERQISLVQSVGDSLCELVRKPFIGSTLRAMRVPAKVAHLAELHHFLERGYGAFKAMKKPAEFVTTIVERENRILENIYSGKEKPFGPEDV